MLLEDGEPDLESNFVGLQQIMEPPERGLRPSLKPRQIISKLLLPSPKGNAWNSRLRSATGGATVWTSTKEAPGWTTRHPATCQKHADCRPLLQQSSPNRGQVVQSGMRKTGFNSRLHRCAWLIDTPFAPPQVPQENQGAHTWNVRPQAPTPAASLKIQRLIPEGSAEALAGQTALFFVALTGLELTFDLLAVD